MLNIICLILQVLIMLCIYIFPPFSSYICICNNKKIYKCYLFMNSIVLLFSIAVNIVFTCIQRTIDPYIIAYVIIIIGVIDCPLEVYARNVFYKKLTKMIIDDHLEFSDLYTIRNHILEKYGEAYSYNYLKKALIIIKRQKKNN